MLNFKKWLTNNMIMDNMIMENSAQEFILSFQSSVNAQPNPIDDNFYYIDGDTLVKFKMTPSFLKPNAVHLDQIHAVPTKTGAGLRFMQKLTKLADQTNTWLELNSVPLNTRERIPTKKLTNFYKSFGFTSLQKDEQNTMIRRPQS